MTRSEPERPRRPWWLPHFLGRMPSGLEDRHLRIVGIVSLAFLFENYDVSMLSAALKQIRESFGLDASQASAMLAWIRLGAIPALLLVPLADRIGRRRVFLACIVGMSVGTFLSGLATSALQFVVLQTLTRAFIVAATATAVVLVAEALPASQRGWGIGILSAIGTFGFGLSAILYAFLGEQVWGWRVLYFVGLTPLLFFGLFRRRVVETERFEALPPALLEGTLAGRLFGPMRELVRDHPRRSLAVAAMAACVSAGTTPAFNLVSDFVQSTHGWSPGSYSLMALVAGALGTIGNPAMGHAADRFGRRPVALVAFLGFPMVTAFLYLGPGSLVALAWIPFVFLLTGGNVLMRVVTSELFPTSSRNTALGWETLHETLGAAVGFVLMGVLVDGSEGVAFAAVAVSGLAALGGLVVWWLPETAGRELEATSHGHAG